MRLCASVAGHRRRFGTLLARLDVARKFEAALRNRAHATATVGGNLQVPKQLKSASRSDIVPSPERTTGELQGRTRQLLWTFVGNPRANSAQLKRL